MTGNGWPPEGVQHHRSHETHRQTASGNRGAKTLPLEHGALTDLGAKRDWPTDYIELLTTIQPAAFESDQEYRSQFAILKASLSRHGPTRSTRV